MSAFTQSAESDHRLTALSQGAHTVRLDDVHLHYRVDGNGPLLFVVSPGWGVGSGYLQRGLDFLPRLFKVVFIDTRGSGQSGRPTDGAKMGSNEMADDLEALRAYLGIPTISLLGHSNGGAIALSFAQHYPDRINKLMLIDSQLFGFGAGEDTQVFLARNAEDSRYASAVKLAAGVFSGQIKQPSNDEELSEFVSSILPLYLHRPEKNLGVAREQLLMGRIAFYAFSKQNVADAAAQNDQLSGLSSIKVPVFIASGLHDWICPVSVAERLHAGIAQSELVIFDESGHMPWIEEPEKFQARLLNFLT